MAMDSSGLMLCLGFIPSASPSSTGVQAKHYGTSPRAVLIVSTDHIPHRQVDSMRDVARSLFARIWFREFEYGFQITLGHFNATISNTFGPAVIPIPMYRTDNLPLPTCVAASPKDKVRGCEGIPLLGTGFISSLGSC